MTTTDEMKEKIEKENIELEAKIKNMQEQIRPLEKQLELNNRVLSVIKYQKLTTGAKHGRKPKNKIQNNNEKQEA